MTLTFLLEVVDRYLAQQLGFSQLTIGLLLIILTGSLPLTSMVDSTCFPPLLPLNNLLLPSLPYLPEPH